MTPPTTRTWARRGHTPVIRVRGRSQRRVSLAAMCCYKPGERSRLIYRPMFHKDHRTKERRSFAWTDFRDLLVAAHQQLQAPIVLVWTTSTLIVRPAYGTSSPLTTGSRPSTCRPTRRNSTPSRASGHCCDAAARAKTAFTEPDRLVRVLRHGLRQIQYRSHLIDGCMTATHLPTRRQHR